MQHPNFHIENTVIAGLHSQAARQANEAEPLGPFVGAWWEVYLAEVIKQAQGEVLDTKYEEREREKNELASHNVKLREELALAADKVHRLAKEIADAQRDMFYWRNRFFATPVGQAEQEDAEQREREAMAGIKTAAERRVDEVIESVESAEHETPGLHAASAPHEKLTPDAYLEGIASHGTVTGRVAGAAPTESNMPKAAPREMPVDFTARPNPFKHK